jgi:hypothetical protein
MLREISRVVGLGCGRRRGQKTSQQEDKNTDGGMPRAAFPPRRDMSAQTHVPNLSILPLAVNLLN